jgi:S-disulfanyl-L-cysteine oxidoreductase SoxD
MKIGALAAGLVLAFSVSGCRVSPPAKLETATMTRIKHSLTVRGKNIHNPLPDSSRTIESGKSAFSNYCVACHGLDGQNTGVPFADRMSPPVPSLKSAPVQSYTDGQLKWVVENGISPSGMPASKGILTDEEMWSIVVYLRHLPDAGSLGEPAMYSGDDSQEQEAPKTSHNR